MADRKPPYRKGQRQRQDSLADQMRDVLIRTLEMGCYDAYDWIAKRFDQPSKNDPSTTSDVVHSVTDKETHEQ